MTAIYDHIIEDPAAWTSQSLGNKAAVTRALDEDQLTALEGLLQQTAHLRPHDVTRPDFSHPSIDPLLAEIRHSILAGRGVVVLSGITPDRFTEDQFERLYWGFGTHLGQAAVQSARGDRLGYVESDANDTVKRGYRGLGELQMHTDSYEIVGLMCVRKAASGGESALVSSLAIHNEILRSRPELLAPLYRGYFYASEEARKTTQPITEREIPVFTSIDGVVSCIYSFSHMRNAAQLKDTTLPADLEEGLAYFNALAQRDDLAMKFMLEPGEIMLWHNYTALHSRTAFTNPPAGKGRRLLRLWLVLPDGRKVDPTVRMRAQTYERIYRDVLAA